MNIDSTQIGSYQDRMFSVFAKAAQKDAESSGVGGVKSKETPPVTAEPGVTDSNAVKDIGQPKAAVVKLDGVSDDGLVFAETVSENMKALSDCMNEAMKEAKKHTGLATNALLASGIDVKSDTAAAFFNIFSLMSLVVEMQQAQRGAERESRGALIRSEVESIQKQADLQMQAAEEQCSSAVKAAAIQIAMGAIQLAGAGVNLGLAGSGLNAAKQGLDTLAGALGKMGEAVGGVTSAAAGIGNAVAGMINALGQGKAEKLRAESTREQSVQKELEGMIQDSNERLQQTQEMITAAMNLISKASEAQNALAKMMQFR